jgi:MFS family permease
MLVFSSLQKWLYGSPQWFIAVYAAVCSFCVYFSMYAFRKPFTAAGFEGEFFLHIDYKVWLVTAQVIGYMLSKFYGIKYISSIKKEKRAGAIVKLILISWLALLLFAITPSPYNIVFLLVNGFPLGMVWGLVFSFVEGRKQTEFMGSVLAVSFIFSSGVVKSIGKTLIIDRHVSEMWMPFLTGGLFVLPMLLFTWLLNHLPPPTDADIALRSVRKPMTQQERKSFLALFLPGIIVIVSTYVLLTILRDFRDNFANEIWTELGFKDQASIFTKTEIPVSLIVLFSMSLLIIVKDNIKAFMINHYIILAGYALALVSTLLFQSHHLNPITWMIMIGTGLYLSYVPFNALYFERMIASYKIKGNVGFIMYIADAFGYLGSVAVLFVKQFLGLHVSWTAFFVNAVLIICTFGIAGTIIAAIYFRNKYYTNQRNTPTVYAA